MTTTTYTVKVGSRAWQDLARADGFWRGLVRQWVPGLVRGLNGPDLQAGICAHVPRYGIAAQPAAVALSSTFSAQQGAQA